MIDSDLAELYGVETKILNRGVRRNLERFPEDFMFQLTKEEQASPGIQIGTLEFAFSAWKVASEVCPTNVPQGCAN